LSAFVYDPTINASRLSDFFYCYLYLLNIAKRLTTIIGKPVVLKLKVDPDLIGGIVIKIGDKLIDGSIRSKLDTLKREIGKAVK